MSNLAKYLLFFFASSVLMILFFGGVIWVELTFGHNSPYFIISIIGFVILTVLLIFVGGNRLAKSFNQNDIPNGLPATATIQNVKQGNLKVTSGVQEIYQLAIDVVVTALNDETWPAQLKLMVPIVQIAQFQPGQNLAVKYDPNNKKHICIDQSNYSGNAINEALKRQPQDIVLQLRASSALLDELNTSPNSLTTEAEVLSKILLIDNFINGSDAYKLRVRVNAKDQVPFDTDIMILIQKQSVYKIDPGRTIYVKYDRNNPQRVAMSGTDKPNSAITV